MWELGHNQTWALRNWCPWTVVLEKTLESPLDCKESQPVHPKGNQPWIFVGRTVAEAEEPILWPLDVKSKLIGKGSDVGKVWRQTVKGAAEGELFIYHRLLTGHEFEQTRRPWGESILVCCSPWGHRESDTTLWLYLNTIVIVKVYSHCSIYVNCNSVRFLSD